MVDAVQEPRAGLRGLIIGLVLAGTACWAALAAWQAWVVAEGDPAPAFFWLLSLALFCGGLTQLNLVGAAIDWLRLGRTAQPTVLAARLPPVSGHPWRFAWSLLSLALAFLLPLPALAALLLRGTADQPEPWGLITMGLAIASLLLGGIFAALGLRAIYGLLIGGRGSVEADRAAVLPGAELRLLMRYTVGRVQPARIAVRLVCEETRRVRKRGNKSHQMQTTVLHQQQLIEPEPLNSMSWERELFTVLPLSARPSQRSTALVIWSVRILITYDGMPDVHEDFALEVLNPHTDEDADLDDDAER